LEAQRKKKLIPKQYLTETIIVPSIKIKLCNHEYCFNLNNCIQILDSFSMSCPRLFIEKGTLVNTVGNGMGVLKFLVYFGLA
jgi:hypothetical protein